MCYLQLVKGKAIPLQTWTGLEGSRKMRLPDFYSRHIKVVSLSALWTGLLYPRKYSWYSVLLEAESTPGPWCDRKDYINETANDTIGNRTRDLPTCSSVPQPTAPPLQLVRNVNKIYLRHRIKYKTDKNIYQTRRWYVSYSHVLQNCGTSVSNVCFKGLTVRAHMFFLWVGERVRACADGPLKSNLVEWTAAISQHVWMAWRHSDIPADDGSHLSRNM